MSTTSATVAVSTARATHASWVRWFFALAVFPLLIAVGAQVRIPMPGTLVPFTLQTLFVFLAGGFLGAPASLASCGMYLLLGCLQVPVFAGKITGFGYLLGPTGGYLLGFLISAPLIAALLRRFQPQRVTTYAMLIALGSLPVLACGALFYARATGLGAGAVWAQAVLPFLAGDALKAILAASVLRAARPRSRQLAA
jgi:biotin transport system substrate-specific component